MTKVFNVKRMSEYAASLMHKWPLTLTIGGALLVAAPVGAAQAQSDGDAVMLQAKDAYRVRDKDRLANARDAALAASHPLAPWADYWALQTRLTSASVADVDAFLARWPDSYVADRLRNDWLLVLGNRRDWATFLRIKPAFRMNDDREVSCWDVLARQQTSVAQEGPGDLREQARRAWWAQKDADTGCDTMAQALFKAGVLTPDDVWRKLRLSVEADKPKASQKAAAMLGDVVAQALTRALGQPRAYLMDGDQGQGSATAAVKAPVLKADTSRSKTKRKTGRNKVVRPSDLPQVQPPVPREFQGPLNLLAFIRWAAMDPQAAAQALDDPQRRTAWGWRGEESAWAWSQVGRQSAQRLLPEAPQYFERAMGSFDELSPGEGPRAWSPDTLAWMARAGLRWATAGQPAYWSLVDRAIAAMPPDMQQDTTWVYWKARALISRPGVSRLQGREMLTRISSGLGFYNLLAAEELDGVAPKPPLVPPRPSESELSQVMSWPGVDRALRLFALGWRTEAVKEWNFTASYGKPGGQMGEREVLALAEVACQREIWDRCINTSERTRQAVDLTQRFPTPMRTDVLAAANEVGLDPAYMYGLMRQESRFITAARSNVGAAGLMQVMPATAQWTAKRKGIPFTQDMITDPLVNMKIGASYLKLVLDDLGGSQAMAAAAYNAGPGRPRRWREGAKVDAAAWAENVPFSETRDYVKRVVANAVVYGHVLYGKPMSIRTRLGATIGPRAGDQPPPELDLP